MFPTAGDPAGWMGSLPERREGHEGNVYMGPEMEDNTNLQLDTGSVIDRVGVRSSLTDINRISVFTDGFMRKKEAVEKERQAAEEELYVTVFVEPPGNDTETDLTDFIFLENTEELLIRNEKETTESRSWFLLGILPVTFILFAAALLYMSNRKGKKKYDADNQSEAIA